MMLLKSTIARLKYLGDETLQGIAKELVRMVHENATIDWTVKENVRAKLRVMVKTDFEEDMVIRRISKRRRHRLC